MVEDILDVALVRGLIVPSRSPRITDFLKVHDERNLTSVDHIFHPDIAL